MVGPDTVSLPIEGLGESWERKENAMSGVLRFKLANGETEIGSYAEGYAQERIFYRDPIPPPDYPRLTPWGPTLWSWLGDDPAFSFDTPYIVERKTIHISADDEVAWWVTPVGKRLRVIEQQVRLEIKDYSGDDSKNWKFVDTWRTYASYKTGPSSANFVGGNPVAPPPGADD